MQKRVRQLTRRNEPYVFLVLLALCVLIEVRSGQFFTANSTQLPNFGDYGIHANISTLTFYQLNFYVCICVKVI